MNVYYKAAQLVADSDHLETGKYWNLEQTCFCTMGAVLMAAGHGNLHEDELIEDEDNSYHDHTYAQWFLDLMNPVARRIKREEDGVYENPFSIIYPWNDSIYSVRTKDDVVQLLNQVGDDVEGK